ncbi:hypothetical protein DOTSEDRAFT_54698 [Dothistroma septosporum NZE10]|uniref:Multifunctional fusion protein n=1 Tax=Dothistroma septosporum (strain NZE10 / CBS 128990) TaxID=675120 RepID=N1PI59_DOTSN|nr:hypothetical protein DOTSEDRAFT_54698 [Dothistroma septosporum NZE10]
MRTVLRSSTGGIAETLLARRRRVCHGAFQSVRALTSGTYRVPKPFNEPNLQFAPNSPERIKLREALSEIRSQLPLQVPAIGGKNATVSSSQHLTSLTMPAEHALPFQEYASASQQDVQNAIENALKAKKEWQSMPFTDRAAIFLRAAELVSSKYRFRLLAATMLGQGKNAWQAEIDAAAELADFFRYNVSFAQEIYDKQPTVNAENHHGRTDWRPLEGFVYAVSPFNFTAIGGNLVSAPALLGNVVVWKPAPMNAYASHLVHQILLEAGLPEGVVQLVNGDANVITDTVFKHREFSALTFIGSSEVFRNLQVKAAQGLAENRYRDFPRMAGETSGKNFHLLHPTADVTNAAKHSVRAAFEYAGQKCSALSRVYVPESCADAFFGTLKRELSRVKVGAPEDYTSFTGPVIDKKAFDRVTKAIDEANKDSRLERIAGGTYDGSQGYYINPTVYATKEPNHYLFDKELFGPVLVAYVYPDSKFEETLDIIDRQGGGFALTGNIFSNDQKAIRLAEDKLRYAAGNFYINCKITAAVIGQQSFGGARASGTCDKAGSAGLLQRFTAPRTLKEEYNKLDDVLYPSNM